MPSVRVRIRLPFYLRLQAGDYATSPQAQGRVLTVTPHQSFPEALPRTLVSSLHDHSDPTNLDELNRLKVKFANRLLRDTNRMIRWYRAVTREADVMELTLAQASPFQYTPLEEGQSPDWETPWTFEAITPARFEGQLGEISEALRAGFSSGSEPEIADLFLLDAEQALQEGRFREAVLFCWSTIDSTFNRKYDSLVKEKLAGEWKDAQAFFLGHEFGLRNKMSAVMHLVANRSLFREPADFWERLSASYTKRNAIIHRGELASEDEAIGAIEVARDVVRIMRSI